MQTVMYRFFIPAGWPVIQGSVLKIRDFQQDRRVVLPVPESIISERTTLSFILSEIRK